MLKARSLIFTSDLASVRAYAKRNTKNLLFLESQFYVVSVNIRNYLYVFKMRTYYYRYYS